MTFFLFVPLRCNRRLFFLRRKAIHPQISQIAQMKDRPISELAPKVPLLNSKPSAPSADDSSCFFVFFVAA